MLNLKSLGMEDDATLEPQMDGTSVATTAQMYIYVRKLENSISCTVDAETGEQEYCCADPCTYRRPSWAVMVIGGVESQTKP